MFNFERDKMGRIDKQSINLLKCIAEGLEGAEGGFEQYFSFEIRGKKVSGTLKVEVEDTELKTLKTLAKANFRKAKGT